MQGILVQQDADNWIRFDTYSTGSKLNVFAASSVDGSPSTRLNTSVAEGESQVLRVTRSGDQWTLEHSSDGASWSTAGSFSQGLDVTKVGPFAAATGGAPGHTAEVDYFWNTAQPLDDEAFMVAKDDALSATIDTALSIAPSDLLSNDSDPEGDALSIASFTQPEYGQLAEQSDGSLRYTSPSGFVGDDVFTYTATDGQQMASAEVAIEVTDPDAPPAGVSSDDFNDANLDPEVWTTTKPTEAATIKLLDDGSGDQYLEMALPSGNYDVWQQNRALRTLQDARDDDMSLEAKFLSTPAERYQMQGILVQQDADNWLRFDTYSDGASVKVFAASSNDGEPSARLRETVTSGESQFLRVTRSGDQWALEYSSDGASWSSAGTFMQAIDVSQVGPFAATTGDAAGYTAKLDYFFNAYAPIADEDSNPEPDTVAPSIQSLGVSPVSETGANVNLVTDEAATVDVQWGPTDALNGGSVSGGSSYEHQLSLSSLTQGNTYHYEVTATDASGNTATRSGTFEQTLPINVWYGSKQTFGEPGQSQRWINILGSVTTPINDLTYSLNGGPEQSLSWGPDTRRLQNEGDFNVDIAYDKLDGSSTDDQVTITATLANGTTASHEVTIDYESGREWPRDYQIDWAKVDNLQNVVQVVDGKWSFDDHGVQPVEQGYDRLLAIGDQSWNNYEVDLTLTPLDTETVDPRGRDGGGIAFGMMWNGHTDDPIAGEQPKEGWLPSAATFYTDPDADTPGQWNIHSAQEFHTLESTYFQLKENVTYEVRTRVERVNGDDQRYSMKIWEQGSAEPKEWTVQATESFDQPLNGSFLLNAHYFDAIFGDISVSPISA
jgi:regulation of enolase protein 1 (concanavalin A-like superfamily)